jgi:hypothetical protein
MAEQVIDVVRLSGRQVIDGKDNVAGPEQLFRYVRSNKARSTCDQEGFVGAVVLHALTLKNWDGLAPKL